MPNFDVGGPARWEHNKHIFITHSISTHLKRKNFLIRLFNKEFLSWALFVLIHAAHAFLVDSRCLFCQEAFNESSSRCASSWEAFKWFLSLRRSLFRRRFVIYRTRSWEIIFFSSQLIGHDFAAIWDFWAWEKEKLRLKISMQCELHICHLR
jgi:hypothetical protein